MLIVFGYYFLNSSAKNFDKDALSATVATFHLSVCYLYLSVAVVPANAYLLLAARGDVY